MSGFTVPVFTWLYQGVVAAGGSVAVYRTGTTTLVTIYSDGALTMPISNPITLDVNGQCSFYVDGTVNLRMDGYTLPALAGALIRSIDPVYPTGAASASGNIVPWVAAGGSADVITATYSPVITSLTDGLLLSFRATAANATTTPTFAPNGLTAHTITQKGGSALVAGNISANLSEYFVRYNLASTRWELMNPSGGSQGLNLLATVNASGAASVTFNSTYITNAYNKYVIEFDGLVNSVSSADLYVTYSTNNGSVYLSSGYFSWGQYQPYNSATITGAAATTASQISLGLGNGFGLAAATPSSGTLKFSNPSASAILAMQFELFASQSGSPTYNRISGWAYNAGTTAINNIKIAPSSGTTTGNFHLYGIAGT